MMIQMMGGLDGNADEMVFPSFDAQNELIKNITHTHDVIFCLYPLLTTVSQFC